MKIMPLFSTLLMVLAILPAVAAAVSPLNQMDARKLADGVANQKKALKLAPDRIKGYYFFAFNAGMYS
ncbi:MAG: hypothetical protein ACOC3F_01325 [Desulfosudaceae bacterium]